MKIVLCGFMGSGKTSIGWRLAKILKCEFIDMDKYIEEKENMPVSEIFKTRGESGFRECEKATVRELMEIKEVVIATGGGTVLNEENVKAFHDGGGKIYFLDVPLAALQERLKRDVRRPLLQRPDRREFIEALHKERYPKYKNASDIVIMAGQPANYVAKDIASRFSK